MVIANRRVCFSSHGVHASVSCVFVPLSPRPRVAFASPFSSVFFLRVPVVSLPDAAFARPFLFGFYPSLPFSFSFLLLSRAPFYCLAFPLVVEVRTNPVLGVCCTHWPIPCPGRRHRAQATWLLSLLLVPAISLAIYTFQHGLPAWIFRIAIFTNCNVGQTNIGKMIGDTTKILAYLDTNEIVNS